MDQDNQDVAPEPQHQFQPEPTRPTRAERRRHARRKWIIIAIILALLLAAGAAGYYWFVLRGSDTAAKPATSTTAKATDTTTNTLITPEDATTAAPAGTTQYVSSQQNLSLSFNYPSNWTVSPKQTTASATTPITITSPSTTIAAADGASVTGKVVVTIRPGGGQIAELVSATAAQDSVQMAYKTPTASQRQYPFLTFVHLAAGSKAAGAFEETMITGGQQFKKTDVISADNLGSIDPLITAGFYQCATTECPVSGPPNLGINYATWQNAAVCTQATALMESFKLN